MTSPYFLAVPGGIDVTQFAPIAPATPQPQLNLSLESLDGTHRIRLDDAHGYRHMPGSTGLEFAPMQVVRSPMPGAYGSVVRDVRADERVVFLPIFVSPDNADQPTHLARMAALRSLVDPLTGKFRIVATTLVAERELEVTYTGGLEGDDSVERNGITWAKVGLTAVAEQPFARARTDRVIEFGTASATGPFIGVAGGTDAVWPNELASSAVIGSNMMVQVNGEVPVYPTLELTGPMTSFDGTLTPAVAGAEWSVSIPGGVAAGETLKLVTDPRARSIRANGTTLAAGRVARGSTLRPFLPGTNVLDVAAPGATSATRVRLSWRELYRSLW